MAKQKQSVALYGATGLLGESILSALDLNYEGIGQLIPVADQGALGEELFWHGQNLRCIAPKDVPKQDVDVAIFACPKESVPALLKDYKDEKTRLIDCSTALSEAHAALPWLERAPFWWPSFPSALRPQPKAHVSLPNSLMSSLIPLLELLHLAETKAAFPKLSAMYGSVLYTASELGKEAVETMGKQASALLSYQPVVETSALGAILAYNTIAPKDELILSLEKSVDASLRDFFPGWESLAFAFTPIWTSGFSGLSLGLNLHFESAPPKDKLLAMLKHHPAFESQLFGETEDGDDAPTESQASLSLRDLVDSDKLLVSALRVKNHSLHLLLMADPLARTAQVVSELISPELT